MSDKTKYVDTITVAAANATDGNSGTTKAGLVTITVQVNTAQFGGTQGYTLVVNGNWTAAGQLDWKVDSSSTRIKAKLCAKGD